MTECQGERPVTVLHEPDHDRYVVHLGDERVGLIAYHVRDGAVVMSHTEVDDAYEGRGIGSRLVAGALDDVRSRGLKVVPSCRFVSAYIDDHPKYADLVA